MGVFQLVQLGLVAALCLNTSLIGLDHYSEWPARQPFVPQPFIRRHFLRTRIPYSLNCSACFQLELLQLQHLTKNSLFPSTQSAYRQFHSTETTLLRIKNDILLAMDQQKVTLLILLDLSAAFDTIDHNILLQTLQTHFGVDGMVLSWIRSYLSGRKQQIMMDGVVSNDFEVPYGVPQGSRLGPLLFTLYTSNLIKAIQKQFSSVSCHCYADDTQLYISFSPDKDTQEQNVSVFEACIQYVRSWMCQNKLKLNDSKTEFLIIGTPRQVSKLNINDITVGNSVVRPSDTVRNLGVSFDSCLNMEAQISNTCKSAFYMLYNLRRIRKYLDQTNAETLIHAFISSKIDYCNGLLYGLPDTQIMKLQRIQNACARLVCSTSKFCHITPLLKNLHWLPIRQRLAFKILLIVYKALNGQAPCYISELLAWKANTYSHNLRSSKDTLLLKPPTQLTKITLGDRTFICAAPKLWNSLPVSVRKAESLLSFKTLLKTHLFAQAFSD